jgi:galactose-1-phosphate uridylyltransferase
MCPPEFVFNAGETCWRLYETLRSVLAEKGAKTVKRSSAAGEKVFFTALGQSQERATDYYYGSSGRAKLINVNRNSTNIRWSSFATGTNAGRRTARRQISSSG